MNRIRNRKSIPVTKDACERLQELYHSKNISVSYATITNKTQAHKHKKTEELYYIVKGHGTMRIGTNLVKIREGDIIPIPKSTYHAIENVALPIEIVVVTHPRWTRKDQILKN